MTDIAESTDAGQRALRDGHGAFMVNPDTVERDAQACRLRRDGKSLDEIASIMGYSDRSGPLKAIRRALVAIVQEPAEEVKALELERLDLLWSKTMEVLLRKHLVRRWVSDGEWEHVLDDGPVLKAVETLLKIQERRARLLGLDAAKKVELWAMDAIDAEIQRLKATIELAYEQPSITD